MSQRARILRVAVVAALFGGALTTPLLAEHLALSELEQRGFQWGTPQWSVEGWQLEGVTRDGLVIESLRVPLAWPPQVVLHGVRVDVLAMGGTRRDGVSELGGASGVELLFEDVSVWAGEHLVAEGLTGARRNRRLDLGGPGTELQIADGRVRLSTTRQSPFDELRGELLLSADLAPDGTLEAQLVGRGLTLEHPLLANRSLPLGAVQAELRWAEESLSGPLQIDDLVLSLEAGCAPTCSFTVVLPETSAEEALAPLAPLLPELVRARRVDGTLGASVTVTREGDGWTITDAALAVEGLAVDGAVRDLDVLRYGPFVYRVRDAEGENLVRESGEGSPDWVALQRVSPWVVPAILASEDAAFSRHGGYDPAQLQEALAADLAAGEVVRGGSTLSQQLAKNLFLSPERTLVRKLRELLLAVELDRVLGKSRVLELYVNVVEWGPEIWGLGQASDRYFLKQPDRLQPHEAAFLAAILPAPRVFYDEWYLAGRAGRYKVGAVLANMADGGALSQRQADRWAGETLRFVPPPRP